MTTFLQGIAKRAKEKPEHRFGNLYELLNESFLKECWRDIRKNAAYGVDQVSAKEYEQNLDGNVHDLVERLKGKRYRAKLVRRQYIPKGDGKLRPLGIPAVEDKLLQLAAARILEAIYEQDFLTCSYGYRPNKGALDAVDKLTVKLQFGQYNFVVEADIQGFFDNIDHNWLIRMLEERIADGAYLRLIRKWLKTGVLDTDGTVLHPSTGTPQGGVISPVLANVYLHYALDLWFHKVVRKRCTGEACLIRYADDFVCAFQNQEEAESFYSELKGRLAKFELDLSATKTRVIPFSQNHSPGKTCFDFLGFEFRWGKDRKGKAHLKRRTARKKLRDSIKRFTIWCKEECRQGVEQMFKLLNTKLRGYYNYYGIKGNSASLTHFYANILKILFKWLNRRSQRHSYNWSGFRELLKHFRVEKPRIVARRPFSRPAT